MKYLIPLLAFLLIGCDGEKSNVAPSKDSPEEAASEAKPPEAVSVNPNLKYEIKGDTVNITGYDEKVSDALIIPVTIEGKPVTSIGNSAFYACTKLTSITIPDGVTSIGIYAFLACTNLTSITIPDGVTNIGNGAFYKCTSLTSITIPDSVTSIGGPAFMGCTSLTSITIPDGVTSIGYEAFASCTSLTSVTLPDSITSISQRAFHNTKISYDYIDNGVSYLVSGSGRIAYLIDGRNASGSVNIPASVGAASPALIGNAAFSKCTSLTSIKIPDSVTSIGDDAFASCTSLITVTFLGDAPKIEDNAFKKSSPTIYREADAKGWTNTLSGRPVNLINDALNWPFDDSVTILDEAKKTIEMLNQRQELDAIDKRLRESAFRDDATVNLDDWGSPLLTNARSQFSWSVKLVNSSNLTGSKERGYVSLTGKRENGNPFEVFFVQGNENQLVLDWDASIGWSEMSVSQITKKLPQDEVFLRCRVGKKPGYDQSFGQDNYSGYVLTGEVPDEFVFAYVNLDRPGGKLIDRNFRLLLNYGSYVSNDPPLQEQKVSLRLKFDNKIGAEGQFEIVEYLNDGWVNP